MALGFLELLEPIFKRGVPAVIVWLLRRGPLGLRLGALLSFLLGVGFGGWWLHDSSGLNATMITTLRSRLEPTPQEYKAIEALLLSRIRTDETIRSAAVSSDFVTKFEDARRLMSGIPGKADGVLRCVQAPKADVYNTFLTDNLSEAYLFLPAFLVLPTGFQASASPGALMQALRQRPLLYRDFLASRAVTPFLKESEGIKIFDMSERLEGAAGTQSTPIQSYFLTQNGLLRIRRAWEDNQDEYYSHEFRATAFFPERPYFWQAVAQARRNELQTTRATVGNYFHVTRPYIDLGGNGIVVTLCKPVPQAGGSMAAFCFDVPLANVAKEISEAIGPLCGSVHEAEYKIDRHAIAESIDPSPLVRRYWPSLKRIYTEAVSNGPPTQSDVFGNVRILQDIDSTANRVAVVVPLGKASASSTSGSVLLCEIDIARLQLLTATQAGLGAGGMLACIVFLSVLLANYGLRIQEQEKAFRSVGVVLRDVESIGYARLDEQGHFVDFSNGFWKMLQFENRGRATNVLKGVSFGELLADDKSQQVYEAVRASRRAEAPTGPYQVRLWLANNTDSVCLRIRGAVVPAPRTDKGNPFETFGVVELVPNGEPSFPEQTAVQRPDEAIPAN